MTRETDIAEVERMPLAESRYRVLEFCRFCTDHKLEPADAMRLVALAHKYSSAATREVNEPGHNSDAQAKRLLLWADHLGFGVDFGVGLWPTLTRDGKTVMIPSGV